MKRIEDATDEELDQLFGLYPYLDQLENVPKDFFHRIMKEWNKRNKYEKIYESQQIINKYV